MPNASLCAKAIVTMMLAGEDNYDTVSEMLIQSGELPRPYLITHERLQEARRLPMVAGM